MVSYDNPSKIRNMAEDRSHSPDPQYRNGTAQERGLLRDSKSTGHGDQDGEYYRDSTRWRRWNACAWASFMALFVLILLVGAWIVSDFGASLAAQHMGDAAGIDESLENTNVDEHTQDNVNAGSSSVVRTNDYILDPDWDYSAPTQRRVYNWTIRDQEHNPDGVFRPMMLVNNQFPGPIIEVNEGDTIVVHVDNQAINATSLHWHGIYQNSTPHMDGTIGVTQCPIAPGGTFTYEFTVSGQSGTYWWHSHQGVQSSDGLHGPLIIHARNEREVQPIKYDTDRVLLLSDHYHDLSSALLWQYLLPDKENAEPVPQSGLLNGRGVRNCDDFPDRKCDNTSTHVGRPHFNLAPNQRHRFRLINVGAFAEFQFQIDEHELAVTEVDGVDVQPRFYHRVNVNSAQRYSVIVNARSGATDSFWLRARMITTCFTDPPRTLEPDALGIVRYAELEARHEGHEEEEEAEAEAEAEELPTSFDWPESLALECLDLNTTDLRPVQAMAAPAAPDAVFYLRSNFEIGAYRLSRGRFNTSTWRPDLSSPTLFRTVDGLGSANGSFQASIEEIQAFVNDAAFDSSRELVIQTTGIQVIDLVISNFDDGNHPIHLHGYKYFVLAQGHGYPPLTAVGAEINKDHLAPLYDTLDLSNPLRRDTASVQAFGWILIRVIADNPGAWALHCHVSWHTEAGLMMQLITRSDELSALNIPSSSYDLCNAEGIEKGRGPKDEDLYQFAR